MKFFSLLILLSILLFSFEVQEAPKHDRVVPKGQNLHKIISFYGTLNNAIDAVVNIRTDDHGKHIGVGSGVIISSNGYIVTNEHVIRNTDEIYVYFHSKAKKVKAQVIGYDKANDLAVIKINLSKLKVIKFADSDELQLTDLAFTIGNGFGLGKTVSQGIISALNKRGLGIYEYENLIQTDAIINPGNSGGALVNNQGELIGINSVKISRIGVSGIGFAIPSNTVKIIVTSIIRTGKFERGYFGASFKQDSEGIVSINSIDKLSNSYKNGLREGDKILSINGSKICTIGDVIYLIGLKQPNESIRVKYLHNNKIKNKIITLTKR